MIPMKDHTWDLISVRFCRISLAKGADEELCCIFVGHNGCRGHSESIGQKKGSYECGVERHTQVTVKSCIDDQLTMELLIRVVYL